MSIGFDKLRDWIKKEDRLAHLDHYLDDLQRQKKHVCSDEVEKDLSAF